MFIAAIEGGEYVGKTTVCEKLKARGYAVRRQPATPECRALIKEGLLQMENCPQDIIALAMALDRRLDEVRNPHEGFVITDRSIISSLVINVDNLHSTLPYVLGINMNSVLPDAVVWLRASEETIRERAALRGAEDANDLRALEIQRAYEKRIPILRRLFTRMYFHEIFVDDKSADEVADEAESFLQPYRFFEKSGEHFPIGLVGNHIEKEHQTWIKQVWDWVRGRGEKD